MTIIPPPVDLRQSGSGARASIAAMSPLPDQVGPQPSVAAQAPAVCAATAGNLASRPCPRNNQAMEELIRTNDLVLISFVDSLLTESGIGHLVLDTHMSVLEGSLGIIPRRILVDADESIRARRLMTDAGLGHELRPA